MKIIHFTDLHSIEAWYAALPGIVARSLPDLVAVSGDLATGDDGEQFLRGVKLARDFFSGLEVPAVVCTGNHDGEDQSIWQSAIRRRGLVAVNQQAWLDATASELRVSAWAPHEIHPRHEQADVVVYHYPPAAKMAERDPERFEQGDLELRSYLDEEPEIPWLILCGHLHNRPRWAIKVNKTWVINPGCDFSEILPRWVEIDTTKCTAQLFIEGAPVDFLPIPDMRKG